MGKSKFVMFVVFGFSFRDISVVFSFAILNSRVVDTIVFSPIPFFEPHYLFVWIDFYLVGGCFRGCIFECYRI